MAIETRAVAAFMCEWGEGVRLFRNGREGAFSGDGNFLYLDTGLGYRGVCKLKELCT